MVRHINLLSLCLMFYVVLNIDATLTKYDGYMFENRLVKGSRQYQNSELDNYDTVTANFLNNDFEDITRSDVLMGNLPTGYKDKQDDITKTSDFLMEYLISLFVFHTFEIVSKDFAFKINDLKEKEKNQVLFIQPLRACIKGFTISENAQTNYSSLISCCNKYRIDEKFPNGK